MTNKDKQYYDTHRDEILRKKALYREKKREEIRQKDRERYQQDPDKYKTKSKKYYNENPEKIQEYRTENRSKILEQNRKYNEEHKQDKQDWYKLHKEEILERNRIWRINNPDNVIKNNRAYVTRTRNTLFEILGGKKCIKCGETDEACLQFDHKNGGGLKDIKENGKGHSRTLYKYYITNPDLAKETLQVLCANCNWKKKKKNNENSYQNKLPPID